REKLRPPRTRTQRRGPPAAQRICLAGQRARTAQRDRARQHHLHTGIRRGQPPWPDQSARQWRATRRRNPQPGSLGKSPYRRADRQQRDPRSGGAHPGYRCLDAVSQTQTVRLVTPMKLRSQLLIGISAVMVVALIGLGIGVFSVLQMAREQRQSTHYHYSLLTITQEMRKAI